MRQAARVLLALGFAGLPGCVSVEPRPDPTRYWVLTAPDPSPAPADSPAGGIVLGLRLPEVPAYLRDAAIVVRQDGHRVLRSDFDVWAEPLEQGVTRVLVRALTAHPRVDRVTTMPFDGAPDCEVLVQLWACEAGDLGGHWNALLVASWEVFEGGPGGAALARGTLAAPGVTLPQGDYGELAAALRAGLVGMAEAIADSVPQVVVDRAARERPK